MKVIDRSYPMGKSGLNLLERRIDRMTHGEIYTPLGIVAVYAQGDDEWVHWTRLDFIHDGTLFSRRFDGKRYTNRGIKMKAMQFAREIVEADAKKAKMKGK